ncbi:MAG TPA: glycosyltransferase family 39 protein [Methylovirgula sp.]
MTPMRDAIITQQNEPAVERRPYVLLVAIILVCLVAVRIAVFFVKPFWLDEVFSGAAAASPSVGALFTDWITKDVHPPLYLLLLHFWSQLFGVSDVALRLPSLIFDVAAIPILYFGLRRTLGVWTATVAALIVAAAPSAILYSAEARSYALLIFLSSLALVFALRIAATRDAGAVPGFTIAAIALALTHYFGLAVAGSLYAWLILRDRRNFRLLFVSGVCFAVFVVPWLAFHVPFLIGKTGGHFWIPPHSVPDSTMRAFIGAWGENYEMKSVYLELIVPLIAIAVVRQNEPRTANLGAELLLVIFIDFAILIAISQNTPLIASRYFLVFLPIAAVACAIYVGMLGRIACLLMSLAVPILVSMPWATFYFSVDKSQTVVWQDSAQSLLAAKVKSVIFFLDDPVNAHCTPAQLRQMGEFFFRRAGSAIKVIPVSLGSPDYKADLKAALDSAPRPTAVLKPTSTLIGFSEHNEALDQLARTSGAECTTSGLTKSCIFH